MKTLGPRQQRAMELLLNLFTLREDALFFNRLCLLEADRKIRARISTQLETLQPVRRERQETLLSICKGTVTNEGWKQLVLACANRLYKVVKTFQGKALLVSPKLAELGNTAAFLQTYRSHCLEMLASCPTPDAFLHSLTQLLRSRFQAETHTILTTNSKVLDLCTKQEHLSSTRYLVLLKEYPDLFLSSHQKALARLGTETDRLNRVVTGRTSEQSCTPLQGIPDLQQAGEAQYLLSGAAVPFSYLEEGLCDFLACKFPRILKDLAHRNEANQAQIQRHRLKMMQQDGKRKHSAPLRLQKTTALTLPGTHTAPEETETAAFFEESVVRELEPRRQTMSRAVPESRKRAHTLRPLGELQNKEGRQNQKGTRWVPQKIMEMRLTEGIPTTIKNMRIRRRRALPFLRDENGWSLLIRQDHPKLAICIH